MSASHGPLRRSARTRDCGPHSARPREQAAHSRVNYRCDRSSEARLFGNRGEACDLARCNLTGLRPPVGARSSQSCALFRLFGPGAARRIELACGNASPDGLEVCVLSPVAMPQQVQAHRGGRNSAPNTSIAPLSVGSAPGARGRGAPRASSMITSEARVQYAEGLVVRGQDPAQRRNLALDGARIRALAQWMASVRSGTPRRLE